MLRIVWNCHICNRIEVTCNGLWGITGIETDFFFVSNDKEIGICELNRTQKVEVVESFIVCQI